MLREPLLKFLAFSENYALRYLPILTEMDNSAHQAGAILLLTVVVIALAGSLPSLARD